MKKKQKQTLKDKTVAELTKMVEKEKESLKKAYLKFDEEKDKNSFKKKRHDIARMLTLMHEKEKKG
jgi:ribosomal protein L29